MTIRKYTIDNRLYTSNDSDNMDVLPEKNYLFELPWLSVSDVMGDRAGEFLQGQLSCDVSEITDKSMRKGAMCNLKGRVLALLDVINWQGFKLVLPTDLVNDTLTSLSKTAMVSRVKLQQNLDLKVYGFYLGNPDDIQPFNITPPAERYSVISNDTVCMYALSEQHYLIVIRAENAEKLTERFLAHHQLYGSLEWHQQQLERLDIQIYPKTRGVFLPHRIDLHKTDFISFDKGCYKGQEIIARTHYKAKLKHGLRKFTIHTHEKLAVGMKLFSPTDHAEIGELVDFCPLDAGSYLIACTIINEYPEQVIFEEHVSPVTLD